jgi:cytochrome c553
MLFYGCENKEEIKTIEPLHVEPKTKPLDVKIKEIEDELSKIDSLEYLENYIIDIINNGSNSNLGFSSKSMEGGYAYTTDAPNIARYVVTLSGKKSSDDTQGKKTAIFYSSNCGGCHGDDGKGLNGTFPDLTRPMLQGILKKKEFLQSKLATMKKELNKE